jgi:DNA-binding NarL/FixJ family response regulator
MSESRSGAAVLTRNSEQQGHTVSQHYETREERLYEVSLGCRAFLLTRRELDVLRLVSEGLTNCQVAERLFLSHNTVHAHLHSIYSKLNVSTRTAATRFAMEHNLA